VRAIYVAATAGSIISWQVDEDMLLLGGLSAGINFVASKDPALTWLNFKTPAAAGLQPEAVLCFNATGGVTVGCPLAFPLLKGEVIYIAFSAAGSAVLFVEPTVLL
jgi:hypothetical protein